MSKHDDELIAIGGIKLLEGAFYQLSDAAKDDFIAILQNFPEIFKLVRDGQKKIAYNLDLFALELFVRLSIGRSCSGSRSEDLLLDKPSKLPEHKWIKVIHDRLSRSLDFKMLQNDAASIEAVAIALGFLLRLIVNELPAPAEPLLSNLDDLRAAVIELKKLGISVDDAVEEGKAAKEKLEDYEEQLAKLDADVLSEVCRQAYEEFKRMIEPISEALRLVAGMDGEGGDRAKKLKWANAVRASRKLQQIAILAGRTAEAAAEARESKTEDGIYEPDGVRLTGDLDDVLPAAFLEALTGLDGIGGHIEARDMAGFHYSKAPKHGGAFVILLDSTGSMSDDREIWAKAVTWALLLIAQEQNRFVRVIHYGDGARLIHDFPAAAIDGDRLLNTMSYFYSDGINNESPAFDKAIECIAAEDDLTGADLVFITDGGCHFEGKTWQEDFAKQLDSYGVNVYSILISCGHGSIPAFLLPSDRTFLVGDFANESALDSLFAEI